jgi:hypothetical protein
MGGATVDPGIRGNTTMGFALPGTRGPNVGRMGATGDRQVPLVGFTRRIGAGGRSIWVVGTTPMLVTWRIGATVRKFRNILDAIIHQNNRSWLG